MAVTVKLYKEVKGAASLVKDLSAYITGYAVGASDGDADVTSTFVSEGAATMTTARAYVNDFNQYISNFHPPEAAFARDAYLARQVRSLLGLQQGGESYEWLTEITGGVARANDKNFTIGQSNAKGMVEFEIRHRPYWRRGTTVAGGGITLDNNTLNYYSIDLTGTSDMGDLPAQTVVMVTPLTASIKRVYLGIARGVTSYTHSKFVAYTQQTLTGGTSPTALNVGGTAVTFANYPSGYARVMIRMNSAPASTNMQISTNQTDWFDVEVGHAIVRGPLVRLPVSRASGISASSYANLVIWARNAATSGNATFPAGDVHLMPADQFVDYSTSVAVALTQTLTDDGRRNVSYLDYGSAGSFDTIVRRGLTPQFANDTYTVNVLAERSDGTAPSADQLTFNTNIYPRRRSI